MGRPPRRVHRDNDSQTRKRINRNLLCIIVGFLLLVGVLTYAIIMTVKYLALPFESRESGGFARAEFNGTRLPTSLIPTHYDIHLQIWTDGSVTDHFGGEVRITITVSSTTNLIVFHSKVDIDSDSIRMADENGVKMTVVDDRTLEGSRSFYILLLKEEMKENGRYTLSMGYRGTIETQMEGLFKGSFQKPITKERSFYVVTQLEAVSARQLLPCWDEPSFRSVFELTIKHDAKYTAYSNMPAESAVPDDQSNIVTQFKPTVPMPTYLLAVLLGEMEVITFTAENLTMRVIIPDGFQHSANEFVEINKKIWPVMTKYYEIPYPLPKLDSMILPDMAFAMENWGLISYGLHNAFFEPDKHREERRQIVAQVVAHELAHQWFGNLVTMEWWSDLWLNEGFARYMQYFIVDKVWPAWHITHQQVYRQTTSMATDNMIDTHSVINNNITDDNQIFSNFDYITYEKGGAVLRMLVNLLGENVFQEALLQYLQQKQYQSASTADLWEHMRRKADEYKILGREFLVESLNRWITQPGYPVVTVTLSSVFNGIELTQKRQFIDAPEVESVEWYIPLQYRVSGDNRISTQLYWMKPNQLAEIKFDDSFPPDGWFIINSGRFAYTRINYPISVWRSISQSLRNDISLIPDPKDRLSLLSDVFDLVKSGSITIDTALSYAEYIRTGVELNPYVWKVIQEELAYIGWLLDDPTAYHVYIQGLIGATYEYVTGGDNKDVQLYSLVTETACRHLLKPCLQVADNLYNSAEPLAPADRFMVYCHIARYKPDEYERLWLKYTESNSEAEKSDILAGLGCLNNQVKMRKFLTAILNSKLVPPAFYATMNVIDLCQGHNVKKMCWNLSLNSLGHFNFLTDQVRMKIISDGLKDDDDIVYLKTFIKHFAKSLSSMERVLKQSVARISRNKAWLENNEQLLIGHIE